MGFRPIRVQIGLQTVEQGSFDVVWHKAVGLGSCYECQTTSKLLQSTVLLFTS